MLALFFLHSEFLNDRVISIVGYSLGTVIIMQMVKVLYKFYRQGYVKAGRILHDIYLWAGAFVISYKKLEKDNHKRAQMCKIISGRLANNYCLKDYVLKYMFKQAIDADPIGIQKIFHNFEDYMEVKRAFNYENSTFCSGHMDYTEKAGLILA